MKTLLLGVAAALLARAQLLPPSEPKLSTVVAEIDGKPVTAGDIDKLLKGADARFQQNLKQFPANALGQYYEMKALAQEGEKLNLADESPLKEQLEFMRMQIMLNAYLTHERNAYIVSEADARAVYNTRIAGYTQAKTRAIFLAFKPAGLANNAFSVEDLAKQALQAAHSANDRTEADAVRLAAELVKRARAGEDFAALAKQYSDDAGTKETGGDFGTISATSSLPDEIKKGVLPLKKGEVSEPIRQATGFHIFLVEDVTVQPFNDVYESIVQDMRQTHVNDMLKALEARFKTVQKDTGFFAQPDLYLDRARNSRQQ